MATYNTYTTQYKSESILSKSGGNYAGAPKQTVLTGEFDASKRNLLAAGPDVAEVVTVPAGTLVRNVLVEVLTTDDATHVFNVGDGNDPDGWVASAAADSAAITLGAGALVVAGGTFYAAADTIDVQAVTGDDLDTLKVRIIVDCVLAG